MLQEGRLLGDSFHGLRVGSCLILRDEFSKETYVLTNQKALLGRDAQGEQQGTWTRWTTVSCGTDSDFIVNEVSFWIVYGQSSCLVHIWSDLVTFRAGHASLSQDGFHWEGFWEGKSSPLHLATPKFSWLVFDCSTMLFIGTSSLWDNSCKWLSLFSSTVVVKRSLTEEKNVYEKIK